MIIDGTPVEEHLQQSNFDSDANEISITDITDLVAQAAKYVAVHCLVLTATDLRASNTESQWIAPENRPPCTPLSSNVRTRDIKRLQIAAAPGVKALGKRRMHTRGDSPEINEAELNSELDGDEVFIVNRLRDLKRYRFDRPSEQIEPGKLCLCLKVFLCAKCLNSQ